MNHSRSRSPLPRRRLTLLHFFGLLSLSALCALLTQPPATHSAAQSEREIENKIPAHLPIKVKVKNLEMVKDLKNEHWLDDLGIEVTNTGNKPIYFLSLVVHLLGTKTDSGTPISYPLLYGRSALVDLAAPVRSEDVPIAPGGTYVFKVPEKWVQGWHLFKEQKRIANPKKIEFIFQLINFGDGTGFMLPSGQPMPNKENSSGTCKESSREFKESQVVAESPPARALDVLVQSPFLTLPASFLPVKIFISCQ